MQANTVSFVPANKQQINALLQYIDENKPAIAQRMQAAEFIAEVNSVKQMLAAYYAINPPQRIVKTCPWKLTGASNMCEAIARKYSIPIWNVLGAANPYM